MPAPPDPERLAAAFEESLEAMGEGPARPGGDDLRRAAAGVIPLLPVMADPRAWAWDLEPALRFQPLDAFGAPPIPWPPAAGPAPSAVQGPLAADILATAAGGAPAAAAIAAEYRARIAQRNPELAAFITVCPPGHPQAAAAPGALFGAALAIKDIVSTAGLRTTGGSRQRQDHVPQSDAACWAALRGAGAGCLGKTNTHEFAAGTTSENEWFGPVRNPRDTRRVAGGSSGGSAAAVAARLCSAAIGTDTGGSVRIPAACCGVVGCKPTYGRVSRAGVFALAWSLDHVGPLAASVGDAALLLAAMAGPDPADRSTMGQPPLAAGQGPDRLGQPRPGGLAGLRIGVPWAWLDEGGATAPATGGIPTSPEVRRAFVAALEACRDLGAEIREVDLGSADFAVAVNRIIALPESAAYHAGDLRARPEGFGRQVRGRLLAGRFVAAEAYLQGQRLRTLLCRRYAEAMQGPDGVHLVATPTLPAAAPPIGAPAAEGLALLRFCAPLNLTGWPAVTLPCGTDGDGLPVGLQLAAAPWREVELLAAAAAVESALPPAL